MCVLWQPVLHLDPGTEHCAPPQRSGKINIYLDLFCLGTRKCHSSSMIMTEDRYVLQKLLSRGTQPVWRQFLFKSVQVPEKCLCLAES